MQNRAGFSKLFSQFTNSSQRSKNVIVQTLFGWGLQAVKIGSSFVLVSQLLEILGNDQYGIWVTLSSMIGWFGIFDLGLDNGLRNEVAKQRALGNTTELKRLIGTSYLLMGSISILILTIGLGVTYLLDFGEMLKVDDVSNDELRLVVSLLFFSFSSRLTFKIVGGVVFGLQKSGLNRLQDTSTTFFFVLLILILKNQGDWSILKVAFVNVLNGVMIWIIFTVLVYRVFKDVRPGFRQVSLKMIKPIFRTGIAFFLSQLASVLIFSTDQFIVNNVFGPSIAASFAITDKVFQIPQILFAIINATLWSSFTDAYYKKDRKWIIKTLRILRYLWLGQLGFMLGLIFCFDWFVTLLGADDLDFPYHLVIGVGLIKWSLTFVSIYVHFVNGVGLVKKQLYMALPASVLNIPLSYSLAQTSLGPLGVVVATLIIQIPFFIWTPWITHKTIRNMDKT